MGLCTICKKPTKETVREPNICKDLFLCVECKAKFEQCKNCGGRYYPKDLKNGYCDNCGAGENLANETRGLD